MSRATSARQLELGVTVGPDVCGVIVWGGAFGARGSQDVVSGRGSGGGDPTSDICSGLFGSLSHVVWDGKGRDGILVGRGRVRGFRTGRSICDGLPRYA